MRIPTVTAEKSMKSRNKSPTCGGSCSCEAKSETETETQHDQPCNSRQQVFSLFPHPVKDWNHDGPRNTKGLTYKQNMSVSVYWFDWCKDISSFLYKYIDKRKAWKVEMSIVKI